jgi:hypothetical protein
MTLISTSWSCQRCGAAYISAPPDHGICDQCIAELDALFRLAPIDSHPCPACGGPSSSSPRRQERWPVLPGR